MCERERDRKAHIHSHSRSILLIFRTLNSIPYDFCASALPIPIAIRMDRHWAEYFWNESERVSEWVRKDWNWLLLPVTMAIFFIQFVCSRSPFLIHAFSFSVSRSTETRMIDVVYSWYSQESVVSVYVRELWMYREHVEHCSCSLGWTVFSRALHVEHNDRHAHTHLSIAYYSTTGNDKWQAILFCRRRQ